MVNNYKRNSKGNKDKFDIAKDALGTKYMKVETHKGSIYFLENAAFTVEVPVLKYSRPEVKDLEELIKVI